MARVIIGLSGGVDSAVAACLLKQEGYDVVGVTLRTWEASEDGTESRCCEIDDARAVAETIGIPFYAFNCVSEFREKVVMPFVRDYVCGRTPNPCVICNRCIKWERMLYHAKVLQADYVATGHYASVVRLPNGRYTVKKALHAEKDQTYMLYRLSQEQLAATLMPLGGYTKQEVRRIAEELSIPVADKPDSQEICFVTDGHYSDFVADNAETEIPGAGNFVDSEGRILGRHRGITHYTVGQRKGLGIALGFPAYVTQIRPAQNEVVLGTDDDLFTREVVCGDVNWLSVAPPADGETILGRAKVRYHHEAQTAQIVPVGEDSVKLVFDEAVRAAAPGQSAVFYDDDDCVIGGGIIR
ncbi:MAG: tRNA 2-thiouridine(34) synthase MnmA [Lachnospiraceae bacterium]|nr:tRNA 2-thiouridine(34) synthase MnmA [Lachnospiraceae bacterium]